VTDQDQPDSNMLELPAPEPLDVAASGEIKDGIVSVHGELDGVTLDLKYPNNDAGYLAVDTLYQAYPQIIAAVLEAINVNQAAARPNHEITEENA